MSHKFFVKLDAELRVCEDVTAMLYVSGFRNRTLEEFSGTVQRCIDLGRPQFASKCTIETVESALTSNISRRTYFRRIFSETYYFDNNAPNRTADTIQE